MSTRRRPAPRRAVSPARFALLLACVIGLLCGVFALYIHVRYDPLADVQAYYLAGQRLNAGLPLYPPGLDVNGPQYYFYPPLLAILFRPLSLLPYPVAATLWSLAMIAASVATLWVVGLRSARTWAAVCILAAPIAWTLSIGQAQSLVTLLTALAAPWSLAFAAHLKLFPALVALWWIGTRRWRALLHFLAWMVGLGLLQLTLEPANSIAFLEQTGLRLVGDVYNLSPYAVSPLLWAVLVIAGVLVALRLAPSRWGWAAAVVVSVMATPRLLLYALSTLLAALADPRRGALSAAGRSETDPRGSGRPGRP